MFYTIKLNNSVIDVAESPLCCCKWNGRMVERCSENDNPNGYISDRLGLYYHPVGWPDFPATIPVENIVLTEVSESVYVIEKARLDRGGMSVEDVAAIAEKNQANIDYNIMMGNLDDPEEVNGDE